MQVLHDGVANGGATLAPATIVIGNPLGAVPFTLVSIIKFPRLMLPVAMIARASLRVSRFPPTVMDPLLKNVGSLAMLELPRSRLLVLENTCAL